MDKVGLKFRELVPHSLLCEENHQNNLPAIQLFTLVAVPRDLMDDSSCCIEYLKSRGYMKNINEFDEYSLNVGLQTVLTILDKWGCAPQDVAKLLLMPNYDSTRCYEAKGLSEAQVIRLSYILNIHTSLKCYFSNPDNVYDFMNMKNSNPPFYGKKPLDVLINGTEQEFEVVMNALDSLIIR